MVVADQERFCRRLTSWLLLTIAQQGLHLSFSLFLCLLLVSLYCCLVVCGTRPSKLAALRCILCNNFPPLSYDVPNCLSAYGVERNLPLQESYIVCAGGSLQVVLVGQVLSFFRCCPSYWLLLLFWMAILALLSALLSTFSNYSNHLLLAFLKAQLYSSSLYLTLSYLNPL